jgi:hypothetical protein
VNRALSLAIVAMCLLAGCTSAPVKVVPVMPSALVPIDAEHNRVKDFGRVFCSTLTHFKTDAGRSWGRCEQYLEGAEAPAEQSDTVSSPYRFLLVGGFGGDCFRDVRAFSTSIAHLREAHGVEVEYFAVPPFGPSSENGRSIARHIDEELVADPAHRYVLVGYSKGAADLLEALRVLDAPKTKVAALVTIAGTVGGTWVPEDFGTLMQPTEPWIAPGCPGNVRDGIQSLSRDVRQRFLRENPVAVTAYSITASSTLDTTSKGLKASWGRLSAYAVEEDGLMVGWEAILPNARYLGAARADHWAIALPFEQSATSFKDIDRNHFPRDALLEAIVRYVSADPQ